jgi:hypothetical protein
MIEREEGWMKTKRSASDTVGYQFTSAADSAVPTRRNMNTGYALPRYIH